MNFVYEGAQQFCSDKGHFFEANIIFYWNFAKGTTAKAQGIAAITVWVQWVNLRCVSQGNDDKSIVGSFVWPP